MILLLYILEVVLGDLDNINNPKVLPVEYYIEYYRRTPSIAAMIDILHNSESMHSISNHRYVESPNGMDLQEIKDYLYRYAYNDNSTLTLSPVPMYDWLAYSGHQLPLRTAFRDMISICTYIIYDDGCSEEGEQATHELLYSVVLSLYKIRLT